MTGVGETRREGGGPSGGGWAGRILAVLAAGLFAAGAAWTAASLVAAAPSVTAEQADAADAVARVARVASAGLLAVVALALAAVRGVRTTARHTFLQCLRMRMAGVFIVLLAGALVILPFVTEGDGTLAGRLRTLLAYGTSITCVLLSLMTIFVSASIVSSDVRTRRIFLVATKPLARWQYVLGRWAGLVCFNVLLLAVAAAAIYAFTGYLRGRTDLVVSPGDPVAAAGDLRTVETEVLTARRKVLPLPDDAEAAAARRLAALKEEGKYDSALEAYKTQTGGDADKARQRLEEEVQKQVRDAMHSVAPMGSLVWDFEGIDVAGGAARAVGTVRAVDREARLARVGTDARLLGRLVFRGPVRVDGVEGRVERLGADFFDVSFAIEDMKRGEVVALAPGRTADVVVDPLIQISYKISPAEVPADGMVYSIWQATNPTTGLTYQEIRNDQARSFSTMALSAAVVDPLGRTRLRYVNLPHRKTNEASSATVLREDVAVLCRVGGFEANYVRGFLLMLIQLAFLAALGVFAGSFSSFPVACLLCFFTLPFSLARSFLTEALRLSSSEWKGVLDAITWFGHYVLQAMAVLLPDFANTLPADSLVNGMQIAWGDLGRVAALVVAVQTLLVLALACLVFRRRELAFVQI